MVKHVLDIIFFVVLALIILTIFIDASARTTGNSWNYIDSNYAYSSFANTSGANIISPATVNLKRTITTFTIDGRAGEKNEHLSIIVDNANTSNAVINTKFNNVDQGNFTAINSTSTTHNYTIACTNSMNYTVTAYTTQLSGVTLTSGTLYCATSATGGYDLSGIIIIMILILVMFMFFYTLSKKSK